MMKKYKIDDGGKYVMNEYGTVFNDRNGTRKFVNKDYRISFEFDGKKSSKKVYLLQKKILGEQWAWIPTYEGLYQVSSLGRVKSFCRNKNGSFLKSKQTSEYNTNKAYELRKENKSFTTTVCRLVAKSFVNSSLTSEDKIEFIDGDPRNLYYKNIKVVKNCHGKPRKPIFRKGNQRRYLRKLLG